VLKIRTKDGKIFSYPFMKVEKYITEWTIWTEPV
jgi:hypothetical protein